MTTSWEHQLNERAQVGEAAAWRDPTVREQGYAAASALTRHHSKTFYLASALLPREARRGARALYAFCRISDDLIDEAGGDPEAFATWRRLALDDNPPADQPLALAWADTRRRFGLPRAYAEQLLDGVARDLTTTRYATFDDLAHYCYGVASTVGLLVMHLVGFEGTHALPYAVKLGVALQLTNILRDVGADAAQGRLYLPLDELARFGLTEDDVRTGRVDDRWRALMRFQIARTRQLYAEALPGIGALRPAGRLAIAAAAVLYRALLDDIERHDYDVFRRRARVSTARKLAQLPTIARRVLTRRYEAL